MCREKNHSLFPRFTSLNETPPRSNIRCGWRIGKVKTSEAKTRFNCNDIAGRTEFCTLLQPCARIRSDEKISRKLFTKFSLMVKASTCCHVSRHSVLVRQILQVTPENLGSTRYSQVRTWEDRKYELRLWFCSANFEESRVTHGSEDSGDLSLRDACLGKKHRQKIFQPKQWWFQMRRRQWKRNEWRS